MEISKSEYLGQSTTRQDGALCGRQTLSNLFLAPSFQPLTHVLPMVTPLGGDYSSQPVNLNTTANMTLSALGENFDNPTGNDSDSKQHFRSSWKNKW